MMIKMNDAVKENDEIKGWTRFKMKKKEEDDEV